MTYNRVLPRDFFNESKLLKCLGQLCVLELPEIVFNDEIMEEDGPGFRIEIDEDNGWLFVANVEVYLYDTELFLYSPYNSKENYPLMFVKNEDYESMRVFTEYGNLSKDFKKFMEEEKERVTKP